MTACMVGWSHSKFGKLEDQTLESLIVDVSTQAIRDAGLTPGEIDEIYLGTFNGGMDRQDFAASLVLQADPSMRFKPSTRVENACATGSAAIYEGMNAIAAKKARFVLAVGVEKMTTLSSRDVGEILVKCSYVQEEATPGASFPGLFGHIAESYFQRYGDNRDALAMIAAKNHANGSVNPLAHMQKDFGFDFCREESEKNPFVAGPLKRTDCSMISDGAAAVVLTDVQTALSMDKAVAFRSAVHVNDLLPMSQRDIIHFEGPERAFQTAMKEASVTLDDLSLVEVHDCFTIAELIEYEAMGLTEKGQGSKAILEGWTQKDGKLPVNPSGGLKAKGHPIGATGVSMHVMAAMQLSGQADAMQIPDAKIAGVFNMGGAAVASYVSILEPLR